MCILSIDIVESCKDALIWFWHFPLFECSHANFHGVFGLSSGPCDKGCLYLFTMFLKDKIPKLGKFQVGLLDPKERDILT